MKKITIKTEDTGKRLDVFLVDKLPDLSRSHILKLIKKEAILINGEAKNPHYSLKEGDVLDIKKTEIIEKKEKKLSKVKAADIKIIEDTPDYVVINKPAGLVVHGATHINEYSLADFLIKKYPEIKTVGDDPVRPGIVHRLDKDVSGLMVVAKNQETFETLKKQFKTRTVIKQYIGLVHGQVKLDTDIINFPIERAAAGYKMSALPLTKKGEINLEGKPALTEFDVIKRFVNYTLLRISIKTGRTHQIRAHMAAYGNPIVGDSLYGSSRNKLQNKKLNLGRIFLVSAKLSFKDAKKVKHEYEAKLPKELEKFLKTVK